MMRATDVPGAIALFVTLKTIHFEGVATTGRWQPAARSGQRGCRGLAPCGQVPALGCDNDDLYNGPGRITVHVFFADSGSGHHAWC